MNLILMIAWFLVGICWGMFIYRKYFRPSKQKIDETTELIIDEFVERGDCHHDYDPGSPSYPGHDDVSYDLDDKGKENIRKILGKLI